MYSKMPTKTKNMHLFSIRIANYVLFFQEHQYFCQFYYRDDKEQWNEWSFMKIYQYNET